MAQESSLHGTGGHPHGTVEIPALSGNHERTHRAMPWQGFDFAVQITRPPEGERRCRPLSEGRHTNCCLYGPLDEAINLIGGIIVKPLTSDINFATVVCRQRSGSVAASR
jgi:hypothetical protein